MPVVTVGLSQDHLCINCRQRPGEYYPRWNTFACAQCVEAAARAASADLRAIPRVPARVRRAPLGQRCPLAPCNVRCKYSLTPRNGVIDARCLTKVAALERIVS